MNDIAEALEKLDPLDDEQWTSDGAPLVHAVSAILGRAVSRKEIIEANPHFTRKEEELPAEEEEESKEVVKQTTFTEEQFMAHLESVKPDELEILADELRDQKNDVDKEIEEKKELSFRIKRSINEINLRTKQLNPSSSDTTAIREYLKSQNDSRRERFGRKMAILQHLSAKDIDPRSPVDAAMGRKNARGTGRPVRLVMQ